MIFEFQNLDYPYLQTKFLPSTPKKTIHTKTGYFFQFLYILIPA